MNKKKPTLDDYQKLVDKLLSNPDLSVKYFPPFEIINQMVEELGEIAREVAHLHGHKKKKVGEKTEGLEAELGDQLFAMICLANSEGLSLDKGLQMKLDKFKKRDVERFAKKK
jgi:NTP pyrophosphatase (non-canonical NTP hydrolase)